MNVLLNGVGRIGKAILKIALETKAFNVVAINELNSNIDNIAYSINYDSTYGKVSDKFKVVDTSIENGSCKIDILNIKDICKIDFKKYGCDIVIDSSGAKVNINQLKTLGLKAIFLTHPNKDADINVVLGVNDESLDKIKHKIVSTSSCNATALLPILSLIDKEFEIEFGDITTIHPLLNHQKVLDSGCIGSFDRNVECNFEFGRSSIENIIPSKTTTVDACSYTLEHINSDILSSRSFRVPTNVVGAIDVTLIVNKECAKDDIINLCKKYEENQKFKIMKNNFEPLVSSDFQGEDYTTIVDHRFTDVKNNKMIKLVIWYDNEWGYASKVVDIVKFYE